MHVATVTRRAGRAALVSFAAYGVARAVADWRRRRPAPQQPSAPTRAVVDEVVAVATVGADTEADQAYYEWRADLLAHADEMQPPVDE